VTAVQKSAFALPAQRPDVQQHFNSMAAQALAPAPTKIVLVDDVITQGCTLLAAASQLAITYPKAQIRGFALVRTVSGVEVEAVPNLVPGTIASACVGRISAHRNRAMRRP
jgi:pyrimidine operon attenuation protein/uracil phosphoribosyltransferase